VHGVADGNKGVATGYYLVRDSVVTGYTVVNQGVAVGYGGDAVGYARCHVNQG
jgi:hypothetical protein